LGPTSITNRVWRFLLGAVLCPVFAVAQVVTETFRDATAPGWVFAGTGYTPTLTSGTVDPAGDGWLRLTSTGNNQATSAYYNTAFSAANATIYASFEYQSWGGTGADGITFFLFDGSKTFQVGADGGSLGYAQKTGVNGLNGGYLGVAIDEFGNFSNPTEGRTGGPGFIPDAFAVRGPGTGTTGYDYLGGTSTSLPVSIDSPGVGTRPTTFNQVQLLISPTNQLTLTLQQGGSSPQTVLSLDLSGYARPDTLKYGFSSGTGGQTNYHEIRNLNVTTLVANLWDGGQGDGKWGSSNNWDPNILPASGSDILLNNTFATTAQTIDTQTNRSVRSLSIDAPFAYVLNNNTITLNAAGVPGFSGIAVTQTSGSASHVINSNLALSNAANIRHNSSGTLALNGNIALGNNTATFDGYGATTVNGVISGTGAVVKNDTGTVRFNGANTYSGGTTVNAGTLTTNTNTGFGTGNITLAGGTLTSTANNTIANTIALTGNSALTNITTSGVLTQTGANTVLTLSGATLSGNVALSNNNTARTLTVQVAAGESTLSGAITNGGTGAGNLTKTGSGTVLLGGNNTYTGATTISDGTLRLASGNRLADASNITIAATGTFDLNGYSERVGNLTAAGGATLDFGASSGNNTFVFGTYTAPTSGVLVISNWEQDGDTLATTVAAQNVGSIYFSGYGVAQEAGSTTSTLFGAAYLLTPVLPTGVVWGGNSSSTYSTNGNWVGGSRPNSTQIAIFNNVGVTNNRTSVNLDANRSVAGIRFDTDATAAYTLSSTGTSALTLTGNVPFIQQRNSQDNTISHRLILGNTTVADVTGSGNLTLSGNISVSTATTNLIKDGTGSGKLILSGNNTYNRLFVNNGEVEARSNTALGNNATTVATGAALQLSNNLSAANALTVSGSGVGGTGAIRNLSGANTLSGAVTLGASTTLGAEAGNLTLSGTVSGLGVNLATTGAGNLTLSNTLNLTTGSLIAGSSGTVTLSGSGNNTVAGATVNSGTLLLAKTGGATALSGTVTIGDGTGTDTLRLSGSNQLAATTNVSVASSGVFDLNGNSNAVAKLDGAAGATVALGAGNLTVSGASESSYAGTLTGTAASSLNKSGTGRLSVSGSNSGFSGTVNLSAGIINASGSGTNLLGTGNVTISGSGNLELQGGATLANRMTLNSTGTGAQDGAIQNIAGNNTVSGNLTLAGASRIQSDSGTLALTGNISLGANNLNLGGAGNTTIDKVIAGTGGLTKDGVGDLRLSGANTFTGNTTISAGSVTFGANNVLANSNIVSLGALGTLNLNGFSDTIASLGGTGNLDFGLAGTGALTLSSGVSSFGGQFLGSGELIIGAGATLTLGSDFTNTNLKITLAGGTLNLNGYAGTLGNLSVTGNSTIDFGATSNSTFNSLGLSFANTSLTLNVTNWTDTQDYFFNQTNPGTQGTPPLNQIVFTGYTGANTKWQDYDKQITPVPEPSTYGAMLLAGLAGLFGWRRYRAGRPRQS
jgi:autotransporter-associated beta strand protein